MRTCIEKHNYNKMKDFEYLHAWVFFPSPKIHGLDGSFLKFGFILDTRHLDSVGGKCPCALVAWCPGQAVWACLWKEPLDRARSQTHPGLQIAHMLCNWKYCWGSASDAKALAFPVLQAKETAVEPPLKTFFPFTLRGATRTERAINNVC